MRGKCLIAVCNFFLLLLMLMTDVVVCAGNHRRSQGKCKKKSRGAPSEDTLSTTDYFDYVTRAYEIAKGIYEGVELDGEVLRHHSSTFIKDIYRYDDITDAKHRLYLEGMALADVYVRHIYDQNMWRFIYFNLENLLNHDRPTTVIYTLVEHLLRLIGHAERQTNLMREVRVKEEREANGMRPAEYARLKQLLKRPDLWPEDPAIHETLLIPSLNHIRRELILAMLRCYRDVDISDVRRIDMSVNLAARCIREVLQKPEYSMFRRAPFRAIEEINDFFRIYAKLAHILKPNPHLVKGLHLNQFTKRYGTTESDRSPFILDRLSFKLRTLQQSIMEERSKTLHVEMNSLKKAASAEDRAYLLHRIRMRTWQTFVQACEAADAIFETERVFVLLPIPRDDDGKDAALVVGVTDSPSRAFSSPSCVSEEAEEDYEWPLEQPDVEGSLSLEEEAERAELQSSSVENPLSYGSAENVADDERSDLELERRPLASEESLCHHLDSSAYRYTRPEFFWTIPLDKADNNKKQKGKSVQSSTTKRPLMDLVIRKPVMETLCKLAGRIKGGENVKWTSFVTAVEALTGTVLKTGGSTTTVFIPTEKAYPIRVDEPHPLTRLGERLLYLLRKLLFTKYGIDLKLFQPVFVDERDS